MTLAFGPHTVIVGAISSGQRSEAFALVRNLIQLSLVVTAIFILHHWPILVIFADIVRSRETFLHLLSLIQLVFRYKSTAPTRLVFHRDRARTVLRLVQVFLVA